MTTKKIAEQLACLPQGIRTALVGHDGDIAEAVGSLSRRQQIGFEIIGLTGLLLLGRAELQKKPPFDAYIREVLFGGRHYLPGYAIVIINDALEGLDDASLASALKAFHQASSAWLDAMRRLKGRAKKRLLLGDQISRPLHELTVCFHRLMPSLLPYDPLDHETYADQLLPFFIVRRAKDRHHLLLYSLRHVSSEEGTICFRSLPAHDELEINFAQDKDPVGRISRCLEEFSRQGRARQSHDDHMRVAPLLADSQPQILQLSDLLLKNTQVPTLEKLWLAKMPESCRKEYEVLQEGQREQWFDDRRHILRDSIILDCIESDPVVVLLRVAHEEGENELAGYLSDLLADGAKEQIDRAKENSGWCGERATPMEQRQFMFFQRLLAIAVARALGFSVSDEHRLKGASWFREEANAKLNLVQHGDWRSTRSDENMLKLDGLLTNVVRNVYEPVMKELCTFYSYLDMSLDRADREFEFFDYRLSEWHRKVSAIQRSTPGALFGLARSLLGDKVLSQCLQEQWGVSLGNASERLVALARNDAPDNMIAVLNTFKHDKQYADTKLSRALKRTDREGVGVVTGYVISFLQDLVSLLDLLIDDTSGYERRLFPYKLTFAVRAETAYGIKRCSYYTDACDERSTRETEVYSDEGVDLGRVYLCLPDRRRRSRRVWVNPLLIGAEVLLGAGAHR